MRIQLDSVQFFGYINNFPSFSIGIIFQASEIENYVGGNPNFVIEKIEIGRRGSKMYKHPFFSRNLNTNGLFLVAYLSRYSMRFGYFT